MHDVIHELKIIFFVCVTDQLISYVFTTTQLTLTFLFLFFSELLGDKNHKLKIKLH